MQPPIERNPQVTFAMVAYNQDQFIEAAIRSALDQDYSPLEVLIFDDASIDQTYQIAQKLASEYKGHHTIKVKQNQRNLGIVGNVNAVLSASKGEIIILAAGDDISVPERSSRIVDFWKNNGRPSFIYSGTVRIDEYGHSLTRARPNNMLSDDTSVFDFLRFWPNVTGAASAIHKDIFETFGPLGSTTEVEDRNFALRGILLNGAKYLNEDLVQYRVSGISDSHAVSKTIPAKLAHRRREMQWIRSFYQQAREDLEAAHQRSDDLPWEQLANLCENKIEVANFILQLLSSGWASRIAATGRAISVARKTSEKTALRELLKLTTIYAMYGCQDDREASLK
jgi:glycosyltransferase involved in cell wall biosynthesis